MATTPSFSFRHPLKFCTDLMWGARSGTEQSRASMNFLMPLDWLLDRLRRPLRTAVRKLSFPIVCFIATGCVTPGDIGLTVASHVIGKVVPIEEYLPQIRPHKSPRINGNASTAFKRCFDRLTRDGRLLPASAKMMSTIDWCLSSRSLSDDERSRLLVVKAILALENQTPSHATVAAAELSKGQRLLADQKQTRIDLIENLGIIVAGSPVANWSGFKKTVE